jgi:hypothetical protein
LLESPTPELSETLSVSYDLVINPEKSSVNDNLSVPNETESKTQMEEIITTDPDITLTVRAELLETDADSLNDDDPVNDTDRSTESVSSD